MFLSVGEISKILGVSTETVRHYVQEGVISPQKNEENNYWEYSSEDFLRLTDVLFYRSAGLSVKEIKTIMDGIPVEDIGKVIDARRKELTNTIKEAAENPALVIHHWPTGTGTDTALRRSGGRSRSAPSCCFRWE